MRSSVLRPLATASALGRRQLSSAAAAAEVEMLQELLKKTQARIAAEEAAKAAALAGGGPKFQIQTFNAISPVGLQAFPDRAFMLTGSSGAVPAGVDDEPHAVLLRSHKLKSEEIGSSVRAIARCGAGTNNIPIDEMSARGIPVFNTPGANANAVKELVLCGLLLSSRGIIEGIQHTKEKIVPEEADHKARAARIEKDKKHFAGQELLGKTLGVAGLGNIGAMVAEAGIALGMNVVGYDPKISVQVTCMACSNMHPVHVCARAPSHAVELSVCRRRGGCPTRWRRWSRSRPCSRWRTTCRSTCPTSRTPPTTPSTRPSSPA